MIRRYDEQGSLIRQYSDLAAFNKRCPVRSSGGRTCYTTELRCNSDGSGEATIEVSGVGDPPKLPRPKRQLSLLGYIDPPFWEIWKMRWASCEMLRESLEKRTGTRPSAARLEEQMVALDCFMERGKPCRGLRLPGDYSSSKQRVPYWARRRVQRLPWEPYEKHKTRMREEWEALQRVATSLQGNAMAKHARWYGPNGCYRHDRTGLPKWPSAMFEGAQLRRRR
jgi:hypothetical protein